MIGSLLASARATTSSAWSRRPAATRCSSRSSSPPSPTTRSPRSCPAPCARRSRHASTRCRRPAGPRCCTPSVIGQTFWRDVLARHRRPPGRGRGARDRSRPAAWCSAGSQSQVEGDAEFVFKHVLIRDTAYGTLPRAARRQLHAATAAHLERSLPDPAELGWILAYHWREAGEPSRRSRTCWRRPADGGRPRGRGDVGPVHAGARPRGHRRRAPRDPAAARPRDGPARGLPARASASSASWCPSCPDIALIEALLAAGAQRDVDRGQRRDARDRDPSRGARGGSDDPEHLPAALALLSGGYGMRGEEGDLELAIEIGDRAMPAWVPGTRPQQLAEDYHMQADHSYWLGRYDGALEFSHLEVEASGDPHSAEFLLRGAGMEGLVLSGLGRYEEALTAVETRDLDRERDGPAGERRHELLDRTAARHLRRRGGARAQLGGRRPARALRLQHAVDQRTRRRDRRRPDRGASTAASRSRSRRRSRTRRTASRGSGGSSADGSARSARSSRWR